MPIAPMPHGLTGMRPLSVSLTTMVLEVEVAVEVEAAVEAVGEEEPATIDR